MYRSKYRVVDKSILQEQGVQNEQRKSSVNASLLF